MTAPAAVEATSPQARFPAGPAGPAFLRFAVVTHATFAESSATWNLTPEPRRAIRVVVRSSHPFELSLQSPAGAVLPYWPEEFAADSLAIEFVTDNRDTWRIVLTPPPADPAPYSICWTGNARATRADRMRWQSLENRAAMLTHIDRGDVTRALASGWRAVNARSESGADSLATAAFVEGLAGDFLFAPVDSVRAYGEAFLLRALALRSGATGDSSLTVANTLHSLGTFHYWLGHYEQAATWNARSLALVEAKHAGQDSLEAFLRKELGVTYYRLGRYAEAKWMFEAALPVFTAGHAADPVVAADLENNLGEIARLENRHEESRRYFDGACARIDALIEAAPDGATRTRYERFRGILWRQQAGLLYEEGRYDEAEALFRRTIRLWENVGTPQPMVLGAAYLNVADICRMQGRYAEAEAGFRKGLEVNRRELGSDHPEAFWCLNYLADLFVETDRMDAARSAYLECVDLLERSGPTGVAYMGLPLRGLANLSRQEGKYAEAEQLYRSSINAYERALGPGSPETSRSAIGLARCLFEAHPSDLDESRRLIEQVVQGLGKGEVFPETRLDAQVLAAEILHRQGHVRQARDELAATLQNTEILRRRASVDDRGRAAFFADYAHAFDQVVRWSLNLGDLPAAVQHMERFRARVLLEQMQLAHVDLRTGMPAVTRSALEQREHEVSLKLAETARRLQRVREGPVAPSLAGSAEESTVLRERDEALGDLRLLEAEIRRASPLWTEVVSASAEPVSIDNIRSDLLVRREAMLLYDVGEESSYVIYIPKSGPPRAFELRLRTADAALLGGVPGAVTSQHLARLVLPRRGDAGAGARGGAAFDDIDSTLVAGYPLLDIIGTPRARLQDAEVATMHALWNVLVPPELQADVRRLERIVIIPDGALHRVPFEALVIELPRPGVKEAFWLERGPIVRYAPSATVLWAEGRMAAPAGDRDIGTGSILSVSDATFDEPAVAADSSADTRAAWLQRAARTGRLVRLPGTAAESEAIVAAFGRDRVSLLQRQSASEAQIRAELPGKTYIHLATHGIVEYRRDDVYAALAVTPGSTGWVDRSDDGFLELSEIYGLHLDADLVVLSACSTHEGSWIEGDGVFALSRGFVAAGCPRVVGSLWRVDDASTAQMVGDMFAAIAKSERANRSPDFPRALRDARLRLLRSPSWNHPYYWAPFVMLGLR